MKVSKQTNNLYSAEINKWTRAHYCPEPIRGWLGMVKGNWRPMLSISFTCARLLLRCRFQASIRRLQMGYRFLDMFVEIWQQPTDEQASGRKVVGSQSDGRTDDAPVGNCPFRRRYRSAGNARRRFRCTFCTWFVEALRLPSDDETPIYVRRLIDDVEKC